MMQSHCPRCRKRVPGHAAFCPRCGSSLRPLAVKQRRPMLGVILLLFAAFCVSMLALAAPGRAPRSPAPAIMVPRVGSSVLSRRPTNYSIPPRTRTYDSGSRYRITTAQPRPLRVVESESQDPDASARDDASW